jgi:serine/threonine-protein kinase HipA
MLFAKLAGITAAEVTLTKALGKDVLLIERFDREKAKQGWLRKPIVSALTLFGLDEMMAAYASYQELADICRHRFTNPTETLRESYFNGSYSTSCAEIPMTTYAIMLLSGTGNG